MGHDELFGVYFTVNTRVSVYGPASRSEQKRPTNPDTLMAMATALLTPTVSFSFLLFLYFITSFFLKVFPRNYPPQPSDSSLAHPLFAPQFTFTSTRTFFTWSYCSYSIYHSSLPDLGFFPLDLCRLRRYAINLLQLIYSI